MPPAELVVRAGRSLHLAANYSIIDITSRSRRHFAWQNGHIASPPSSNSMIMPTLSFHSEVLAIVIWRSAKLQFMPLL
jgi:hypothetical protein